MSSSEKEIAIKVYLGFWLLGSEGTVFFHIGYIDAVGKGWFGIGGFGVCGLVFLLVVVVVKR
jgi:hypothetical protein